MGARAPVLRGPGLRCSVVPGRFCPSVPPSPPREGHRAAGGLLGPGPEERGSRVSEITVTSVKVNSPASILQTAFNLTFFFFFLNPQKHLSTCRVLIPLRVEQMLMCCPPEVDGPLQKVVLLLRDH